MVQSGITKGVTSFSHIKSHIPKLLLIYIYSGERVADTES